MDTEISILYWTMIGTWVAGIGTVSAVLTSLYLAKNTNKIKLVGNIQVYSNTQEEQFILGITISNVGNKMANIKFINWEINKIGMLKKTFISKQLIYNLPKILLEGEEHRIDIDLIENNWLADITELTNGYDIKKLKLIVNTTQDKFEFKIDETLVNEIMEERKNLGIE
jgi:hypothetical protein